jgi:hypothetical protein
MQSEASGRPEDVNSLPSELQKGRGRRPGRCTFGCMGGRDSRRQPRFTARSKPPDGWIRLAIRTSYGHQGVPSAKQKMRRFDELAVRIQHRAGIRRRMQRKPLTRNRLWMSKPTSRRVGRCHTHHERRQAAPVALPSVSKKATSAFALLRHPKRCERRRCVAAGLWRAADRHCRHAGRRDCRPARPGARDPMGWPTSCTPAFSPSTAALKMPATSITCAAIPR